jgi:cAMP-dependent protein kinase regulator
MIRKNEVVIRQGDQGDNLYFVDSGQYDCFIRMQNQRDQKHVKVYGSGESFGELALLYNAPRAATIVTKESGNLFALDRETFNHIVRDAARKKREHYELFLKKVELFGTMEPYERSKLSDSLRPLSVKSGEFIIKMGEVGDTFYILEQGNALATKPEGQGKTEMITICEYKAGDYFGELALLRNSKRAANVLAKVYFLFKMNSKWMEK